MPMQLVTPRDARDATPEEGGDIVGGVQAVRADMGAGIVLAVLEPEAPKLGACGQSQQERSP